MLKGTRREFFTEQCEEHQCRLLIFFSVKTTNSRKNNRDKKLYGVQLIYCCLCRCSPCRYTYTQLLQISNHMSLITVCTNSDVTTRMRLYVTTSAVSLPLLPGLIESFALPTASFALPSLVPWWRTCRCRLDVIDCVSCSAAPWLSLKFPAQKANETLVLQLYKSTLSIMRSDTSALTTEYDMYERTQQLATMRPWRATYNQIKCCQQKYVTKAWA